MPPEALVARVRRLGHLELAGRARRKAQPRWCSAASPLLLDGEPLRLRRRAAPEPATACSSRARRVGAPVVGGLLRRLPGSRVRRCWSCSASAFAGKETGMNRLHRGLAVAARTGVVALLASWALLRGGGLVLRRARVPPAVRIALGAAMGAASSSSTASSSRTSTATRSAGACGTGSGRWSRWRFPTASGSSPTSSCGSPCSSPAPPAERLLGASSRSVPGAARLLGDICAACRRPLDPAWSHCAHCGAPVSSQPPTPAGA